MREVAPLYDFKNAPKEMRAALELHQLTARLAQCDTPQVLVQEMLDALIDYHGADFGNVQLLEPPDGDLRIVTQRGFADPFLDTFRTVSSDSPCACGRALRQRRPIVIENVESDPEIAPYAGVFKEVGVRAVQSMPLIGSDGDMMGVVSTHFAEPRLPSMAKLQTTALYARQSADLLRLMRRHRGSAGETTVEWNRQETTRDSNFGKYAPFYRKAAQFSKLQSDQLRILQQIVRETREYDANTEVVREGNSQNDCFIMLEGWGCKFKVLEDGARQIIHFPIPGDFVGVHAQLFKASDHSFTTITSAELGVFSVSRLQEVIDADPRLGQAILWSAARDEAIMVEHLVNLGRRSAIQRLAHFLLELAERMKFAGLGDDVGYRCPLTQEHLADALGLTSIHVNRILRRLREDGLVSLSKGTLTIRDVRKLSDLASFDPEYLDQAD